MARPRRPCAGCDPDNYLTLTIFREANTAFTEAKTHALLQRQPQRISAWWLLVIKEMTISCENDEEVRGMPTRLRRGVSAMPGEHPAPCT